MVGRWWLVAGLVALLATPAGASSRAGVQYVVDAELDPEAGTIAGTVEVHGIDGRGGDLALILYPNRFAIDDPGVNDLRRRFVYPDEELVPGGTTVARVALRDAAGTESEIGDVAHDAVGDWPSTLLRVRVPAGTEASALVVSFRTVLPERFGGFGVVGDDVTAVAGWFPLLAAPSEDVPVGAAVLPASGSSRGRLRVPATSTTVVDERVVGPGDDPNARCNTASPEAGTRTICFQSERDVGPVVLASADYRQTTRTLGATEVVHLARPVRFAHRMPSAEPRAEVVFGAVERILAAWPSDLPAPPARLVVAEAPLRLALTAPAGPGVVVASDRILRVHRLLRDLHERELATAIYAAAFGDAVAAREAVADAGWVTEGLAATLADDHVAATHPERWSVYDWIGLLNVFAIVDRFETSPLIPFRRSFFPDASTMDDLGDGMESFARDRPPGRTMFQKLENVVGDDGLAEIRRRYLAGDATLLATAAAVHGAPVAPAIRQWTGPYPQINYRVAAVEDDTGGDGTRLVVARDSARTIREPVEIELVDHAGERVRLRWDDAAEEAVFDIEGPARVASVRIDPDRKLLEETLVDNARPRPWQVVAGGADATVTSSQFAMSALFVARKRYDYTKDLGLIGFVSNRGAGFELGPRWHFGTPIDANRYRHNLALFYRLGWLRSDFTDDSRPGLRTDGRTGGLGFRYDYSDALLTRNPTSAVRLRLFGTWYDDAFGSTFDYLDGGIRASIVRPLLSHRTLIAGEVLNAFSGGFGGGSVPLQGQFSLGGNRAIRGIPVDERLGENIILVRAELRQRLQPDVDWSLFDFFVLRHHQLRLFVDTGRVETRRSSLYRVSDFAVGAGIGLAAVYDFMGFHPGVFYLEIARRLDNASGETNGVQVLFGTRQAF